MDSPIVRVCGRKPRLYGCLAMIMLSRLCKEADQTIILAVSNSFISV